MRYLAIHEDKCIISDVASDMPITNGTVLGKPAHEVIHDIFAKQVKDLYDVDITYINGSIERIIIYANEHISVIHNPYMCDVYNCSPNIKSSYFNLVVHTGYIEFIWRKSVETCVHYVHEPSICKRCKCVRTIKSDTHECIECQYKPPLQAMTKCAKCGCIWVSETGRDECSECERIKNDRMDYEIYEAKKCRGCGCLLNHYSMALGADRYLDDYCNTCTLLVGRFCFICGDFDMNSATRLLRCSDNELYVEYNGEISNVLMRLHGKHYVNPIREYDKSRFDTNIAFIGVVHCHATCANVACKLSIFTKPDP